MEVPQRRLGALYVAVDQRVLHDEREASRQRRRALSAPVTAV